jgi:hypothetical protein
MSSSTNSALPQQYSSSPIEISEQGVLAKAGIFQGVEPSAVTALTKQLEPVDFPRGHCVNVVRMALARLLKLIPKPLLEVGTDAR